MSLPFGENVATLAELESMTLGVDVVPFAQRVSESI